MQPVHADPAVWDNWAAMLGDERAERGFAWPEYEQAGALLAFSTDAPTAPYPALPNLYVATTRRSALDDSFAVRQPGLTVELAAAIRHATIDGAASVGVDAELGSLVAGKAADFVVLDVDPFAAGPESLITATVTRTVVAGRTAYAR